MASFENPAAVLADFPDRVQDGVAVLAIEPARRLAQQRIFGRKPRFVERNKRGAGLIVEAIDGTASVAMQVLP